MRSVWLLLPIFLLSLTVRAQVPFDTLELAPVSIAGAPALHSGAWAQWEGRWYFIGGRTNGLHGFLPPLAFPSSGRSELAWEVDPTTGVVRSTDMTTLSTDIFEAVTSSNMQFYQSDSILYLLGGYGWNDSASAFRTFPTLTAVNLRILRDALDGTATLASGFRQLRDSRLAVCGAHLGKVGDFYVLPWGHRFDGIYDRSDTTGFFEQVYTHAVRRFKILDDGMSLAISDYSSSDDTLNYRRRDYNLVSQVMPDGSYGYTGFTGVFQLGVNLPYLNTVNIGENYDTLVPVFEQKLSQYHSAFAPLHDSIANRMYSLFFGGMSRYHLDSVTGALVEDTLVPFVRTISLVTRWSDGSMTEAALPVRMPGYMGSNMYFIPDPARKVRHHDVIAIDTMSGRVRIGWLYGGMTSPEPNISETDPALSWATPEIYEVWITRDAGVGMSEMEVIDPVSFALAPNPASERVRLLLQSPERRHLKVTLLDLLGQELETIAEMDLKGSREIDLSVARRRAGTYYVRLESGDFGKTLPLVIRR